MPPCKIQWVDSRGIPTPDQNPAIGTVVCNCQQHSAQQTPLPICAEHLARFHAEHLHAYGWMYTAYPRAHCPACGAGLDRLVRYSSYTITYAQHLQVVDGFLDIESEKEVNFEHTGEDVTWACEACEALFDYDIEADWELDGQPRGDD